MKDQGGLANLPATGYSAIMPSSPSYRRIGIVGTGRVARALGRALAPHSVEPIAVDGRNAANRAAAIQAIGHAHAADPACPLIAFCDVVIIAVADDGIAPVVADLMTRTPSTLSSFVCHVSGRSGAALLEPLRAMGAGTAAIHPAMTFTGDPEREVQRMRDARFAITAADEQSIAQARKLVALLGGIAVEIEERHRPLYHAALSHAANHLVTLISGASSALTAAGVDEPGALLAPLVRAALENSLSRGFDALSGPLLRGDRDTIAGHLQALTAHQPQLLPAYRAMALATIDALERGAKTADMTTMRTLIA